jgi:uncharacterized protein YdhG (YjbR/CyaY superfamily)
VYHTGRCPDDEKKSREGTTVKESAAVDAYVATFPPAIRARLAKVRRAIRVAAPHAVEGISYRIPSYKGRGVIVYFAGFIHHVGLFPPLRGDAALARAAARYAGPKGNLKFPHDAPLPLPLITRIVKHKARQDAARGVARRKPR